MNRERIEYPFLIGIKLLFWRLNPYFKQFNFM